MIIKDVEKSQTPAVDKVLDILDFLADNLGNNTAASIIKKLGIPQASGFRIINTLIRKSYIFKNPETNYISLGYKAIRIGNSAKTQSTISRMIHPILEDLTKQTGESAELAWVENSEIYFLDMTESPQPVRLLRQIGMRILGIKNPVAVAILSYLPKDQRRRIISLAVHSIKKMKRMKIEVNQQGIVYDADIDRETLKSVLEQGYVLDYGVQRKDIARVVVPLLNNKKIAVGALSIAAPLYRMRPEHQNQIITLLKENAEKINILLSNREI